MEQPKTGWLLTNQGCYEIVFYPDNLVPGTDHTATLNPQISHSTETLLDVLLTGFVPRGVQPGAVKLVLCCHWMHLNFNASETSEDQFHCTSLYNVACKHLTMVSKCQWKPFGLQPSFIYTLTGWMAKMV